MHALQNWRAYLPARDRLYEPLTLLLIALLILGILSFVLFSLLPNARLRGALQTERVTVEQAVALEQTIQANAPTRVAGQIHQAETQVAEAAGALLSEAEANGALNRLYQYARMSGVTIVDLKAQSTPNVTPDAVARVLRFSLQVEGTLPRLMNFLARIEETARAGFALTNVAIQAEQALHIAYMDLALHISPYAVAGGAPGAPPTPIPPAIETTVPLTSPTTTGTAATNMSTPTATSATPAALPVWPTVPLVSPASFPQQAGCPNLVRNGGFEAIDGWLFGPSITPPRYTNIQRQAGLQAMQLGILPGTGAVGRSSYSSIRQLVTIPPTASRAILYWWQWAGTEELTTATLDADDDRQELLLLSENEQVLAVVQQNIQREAGWQLYAADLTNYRGQRFYLHVNVFNNGNDRPSWLYLDEVVLQVCDPAAIPSATATPTATVPPPTVPPPTVPPATLPPATAMPTATGGPGNTSTPTTVPACNTLVSNGGFEETGGWLLGQSSAPPAYVTSRQQTGLRAMQLGRLPGIGSGSRSGYSSIRQLISIPSGAQQVTLRWWQWAGTEESQSTTPGTNSDRQEVLLLTPDERVLAVIQRTRVTTGGWQEQTADLTAYRGRTVYLYVNVFNDNNSLATWLYLDEVALWVDCVVPATPTQVAPTATATPTMTPTQAASPLPTLTEIANCTELLINGDFENSNGWLLRPSRIPQEYTTDQKQSGTRSMRLGKRPSDEITANSGYSSISQEVTIPDAANSVILRWWQWAGTQESETAAAGTSGDRQEVLLLTPDERVLYEVQRVRLNTGNTGGWQEYSADVSAYRGRTVSLYFNVYNDGVGGHTWMYVDRVQLSNCSSAAITPTVIGTPVASADVVISEINYNGNVPLVESDEFAVISNIGTAPVNLSGWRLNAGESDQNFVFPNVELGAGESVRVYTNEIHTETGGLSFALDNAIWLNEGDCGYLFNSSEQQVSEYCY